MHAPPVVGAGQISADDRQRLAFQISTNLKYHLSEGTVIEATVPLKTLLANSDVDLSLPMSMVAPPLSSAVPALRRSGHAVCESAVPPGCLLVRNHRPFYGSRLKMASTPERIEAGWWSRTRTRNYFIAEGQDHTLYWVYRERIAGAAGDANPRWFLHGLFE